MGELTSEFCEGLRDGAIEKIEELGGEAVYLGADGDATKQATQIDDLISQGCKGRRCVRNGYGRDHGFR